MAAQFAEEREEIIMDFLHKQGSIHIGDVTDMLKISPSTARLLLQKMQDKGMLRRTHGGAIPVKKPDLQGMQAVVSNGMVPGTGARESSGPVSDVTTPREAAVQTAQAMAPEMTLRRNGVDVILGQ